MIDKNASAKTATLIGFDTETTGLSCLADRITELSAVKLDPTTGQYSIFSELVDPGVPITEEITKITGITTEMVTGKPPIKSILPKFLEFIGEDILIAHNAGFDIQFLGAELWRSEMRFPDAPVLCSLVMARALYGKYPKNGMANLKLATLYGHFFPTEPNEGFHRATADALACHKIASKLLGAHPRADGMKVGDLDRWALATPTFQSLKSGWEMRGGPK